MAELIVKDVALRLGDNEILKGVSLAVPAGEVVALLGPPAAEKPHCCALSRGWRHRIAARLPSAIAYSSMPPAASIFPQKNAGSDSCFNPTRCGRIALFSTTSHMG